MLGKSTFLRSRKPTAGSPPITNNPGGDVIPATGERKEDKYSKALPALPRKQVDSTFSQRPRVSSTPQSRDGLEQFDTRTSSLTPPAQNGYTQNLPDPPWHQTADISPPDSPDFHTYGSRPSSGVSSLSNEPAPSVEGGMSGSKFASHLPVFRKGVRKSSLPALPDESQNSYKVSSTQAKRETRWDDFSGEPSDSGRSAQVVPGQISQPQVIPKASGSQSTGIFGWGKEQFQPRKKFAEARSRLTRGENIPPAAGAREPWKGQSGRSPMVNPIQEKSGGRSASQPQPLRENKSPSPDLASLGIVPSVVTTITGGAANTTVSEKRTATKSASQPQSEFQLEQNHPVPTISASGSAPPRVDLPHPELNAMLTDLKLTSENQPGSRFSATTYAPTEAPSSTNSRRGSVDTLTQSTEDLSSIMSRKRPFPSMSAPGKMPTRKPTPSQIPGGVVVPQEPEEMTPEKQIESRIKTLETRRDALGSRRANINTIIHELTQVIQPSPIAYDMAAREEVKKTVVSLNSELAEIRREEHEIGVKLLRLWKKRDEGNDFSDGSGLWVKRNTS